jgi:cytidine deaminase
VFALSVSWVKDCALPMETEQLIEYALEAKSRAYAPYSNFSVGAALETSDGKVFAGCNVENISFGLTICAERSALSAAVSAGYRDFKKIVIISDSKQSISPCGACRQVLAEFSPSLEIISVGCEGERYEATLDLLLPRAKTGILDT